MYLVHIEYVVNFFKASKQIACFWAIIRFRKAFRFLEEDFRARWETQPVSLLVLLKEVIPLVEWALKDVVPEQ